MSLLLYSIMNLPDYKCAKEYVVSSQGLQKMLKKTQNRKLNGQDVLWTSDVTAQLPIRLGTEGISAVRPTTLIEQFRRVVATYKDRYALSVKINGRWFSYTYSQYYDNCLNFAKSLVAFKFPEHTAINIIGFNAPEWSFVFYGSLFARCLPVGIYTTNSQQACQYIAEHSEAKLIFAQNREYVKKYIPLLQAGKLQLIVFYNDPEYHPQSIHAGKIISYDNFIKEGERVDIKFIEQRIQKIKPGHCCTLVYTSGTTGMPKGVMISHDNYTWTKKALNQFYQRDLTMVHRIVSFLPLSHVAAQFADIVGIMMEAGHVFFADPSALQGTLIQTLQEVRPTFFFSVPRVWEKIYDKMMEIARSNGWLKTKIATWAKGLGPEGTVKQLRKQQTSWQYKLAKVLIFNNVKKALGLDKCQFFLYGAAPLDPTIRKYFLSLNFFLINSYGMSESTGPQNLTNQSSLDINGPLQNFREVGRSFPGTQLVIKKASQKDQDGQMCFRGRNVFMGYYKNPEDTAKTIDNDGFLHSGDNGKLTKDGVLFITGRAKELIITAGGQNVPPVLIENQIRAALPFLANVMVIGDMRKYLTCFITLKEEPPASGKLDPLTKEYFAERGTKLETVKQTIDDEKVRKIINEGLKKANEKAISRAQYVQDFIILPEDFSVENDTLTSTLKLKRNQVVKKYAQQIEKMYQKPSL